MDTDAPVDAEGPADQDARTGLADLAMRSDLLYGCGVTVGQVTGDQEFARAVAHECNIIVPEYELKWASLSMQPGVFNFDRADALFGFAERNGIRVRGHALVWHEALPAWVEAIESESDLRDALETFITAVVSRYRGRVHSWDVLNEILDLDVRAPSGLRRDIWLNRLGPDYMSAALDLTARLDPDALMTINEYGLIYDTDYSRARRAHMLAAIDRVLSDGVRVDAVGLQGHLGLADPPIDARGLASFAGALNDRGIRVMITEMDVNDRAGPQDPEERDRLVADQYAELTSALFPADNLEAVLTWGLSDRYSWIRSDPSNPYGANARPLLLNEDMQPKEARRALAEAFRRRAPTI